MEVHQVLHGLHFVDDVLGQELRQRRVLLTSGFVQDDDEAPNLLQVLHLRADQILVTLQADYWHTVVAHVAHDLSNQLS